MKSTVKENFAVRIRQLRKQTSMTQKELADKLGISRTCIANWETQKRLPSEKMLFVISEIFNVSIDYLLGRCNKLNMDNSRCEELSCSLDMHHLSMSNRILLREFYDKLIDMQNQE